MSVRVSTSVMDASEYRFGISEPRARERERERERERIVAGGSLKCFA